MSTAQNSEEKPDDIEFILEDIGGTFGKFQILNYILFALPLLLSSIFVLDYVFSSLDLEYRCLIPECENASNAEFHPSWLENAVPFEKSKPMRCMRYEPIADAHPEFGSCDATAFNQSSVVRCSSGQFVYQTDEVSVLNEFNLTCEDTNWKLSLIGVTSNFARLIFLPIFGHLSDRFGRLPVLIMCGCAGSAFKFLSSFSITFEMFLVLTFFDAGASSTIYSTAFILGIEWATAEKRIFVSTIIMVLSPFGAIVTAFVASQTHNFKSMLRIISLPGLLLILYTWLARESLRWLLVKKKYDRAMEIVVRATKINKTEPSQRTFDIIAAKCRSTDTAVEAADGDGGNNARLTDILKSNQLVVRFLICISGWIGINFIVYGMSITSVSLPGDKYWNFSIIQLSNGPGVFLTYFTLTHIGRKWALCSSMIVSGIMILASSYASNMPTLSLVLFFVGKLFIRHSLQANYVYTGELWPTSMRHTIFSICSMFGRIGPILASLVPLLAQYSESLPYFLFFGTAIAVGFLFLLLPETFSIKLPDTIEEAKSIGKVSTSESTSHFSSERKE